MKQTNAKSDPPDSPAMIKDGHVKGRTVGHGVGKQEGWDNLSVLEKCAAKGQLAGGSPKFGKEMRLLAGMDYTRIWDDAQGPGRDSTQALNVAKSSMGGSLPQSQSDAIRKLVCIDSHLGQRDRLIIRKVCGEGYWPSEAVREVCGDYRDTISARLREALDALCEAMETVRREPGMFNVVVARETSYGR